MILWKAGLGLQMCLVTPIFMWVQENQTQMVTGPHACVAGAIEPPLRARDSFCVNSCRVQDLCLDSQFVHVDIYYVATICRRDCIFCIVLTSVILWIS